jgi:hypothetical protein
VEFEQRVALAVERRRGVDEITRDMTAQLPALLLCRLGLRDRPNRLNHAAFLRRAGEKYRPTNVVQ